MENIKLHVPVLCEMFTECQKGPKASSVYEKIQSESTSSIPVCEEEAAKMLSDDDVTEEDDPKDENTHMEIPVATTVYIKF